MITVMGATGNTGGAIVRQLAADGIPVRGIGRSAHRLASLPAGVETWSVDLADRPALADALHGSTAAYVLLPTDPTVPDYSSTHDGISASIVGALTDSGVPHVVALSSLGADRPTGTGFVECLHRHELRLRELEGVSQVILRSAYLYETLSIGIEETLAHETLIEAIDPSARVPMVAAGDVATIAAAAPRGPAAPGVTIHEVTGPDELTMPKVTRLLGAAFGRPGPTYARPPDATLREILRGAGFSLDGAELYLALGNAISDGTLGRRGDVRHDLPPPERASRTGPPGWPPATPSRPDQPGLAGLPYPVGSRGLPPTEMLTWPIACNSW
ncbi:MAG TPA: NAD(P)H-binding protein [Thermomicrobiales bacterium]|jgi:uncharacterized protein YbjT (DUF2867 family)|nr:NAD(P)H-binding protein [Thermomicrobiales bacterium]